MIKFLFSKVTNITILINMSWNKREISMKNVKSGSWEMTKSKMPKIGVGNKWSGKIVDEGGFGKSMFMLDVHLQVI